MRFWIQSVGAFIGVLLAMSGNAQSPPDFTGHWRQETQSGTQRLLDIEQNGKALYVRTTVTNPKETRNLEVRYQIGGPETVFKGLDGDEFHSSVHWDGSTLVFDTIEHEGGRKIPQMTAWTLSEDRNSLQVKRQSTKSGKAKDSLTTYVRQP